MTAAELTNPILNSPYTAPEEHFELGPDGPTGTVLPNANTRRVRFMVADGTASVPGQWRSHQRTLAADFLKVFGDDTQQVPPAVAVVIGADSDSTAGRSLGYIGDVKITP